MIKFFLKALLIQLVTMLVALLLMAMGFDALEYEATGACQECVILPVIRPGLVSAQ